MRYQYSYEGFSDHRQRYVSRVDFTNNYDAIKFSSNFKLNFSDPGITSFEEGSSVLICFAGGIPESYILSMVKKIV